MSSIQVATLSGSPAMISQSDVESFRAGLRGRLLLPGDESYDDARTVYNAAIDRHPGAIVRCRGTADVIDAVKLAERHELLMAVRGGGHNVAGLGVCDDGLVIDLTEMRGVHLNLGAKTVRVQGGATWGDLDRETQAFGLITPGGVVSTTGIGGLTLNGGLGHVRNKFGLSCDNLVSADVVTGNGELLTASATENADLFWALRGGGGNFGVVVSFEFKTHPLGPVVAVALAMYPLQDSPTILRRWRDWVLVSPSAVSSLATTMTIPAIPQMPSSVHDKDVLIVAGVYTGDVDEGERLMRPLREFGAVVADMSGPMPYRVLQTAFDPFFPKGVVSSYWKAINLGELSDAAIDIVADASLHRTSPRSGIAVIHFGPVITSVPTGDTAFAGRDARFVVSLDANWYDKERVEDHKAWSRSSWDRLRPYSTGGVYLNYLGDARNEALIRAAFGANYDRLAEVKGKYDPANRFRLNQNIRPSVHSH
jgi:FAD/FMN-containing dehydrogenase